MAGTDQCYMHFIYLGNTDVVSAQMSKVHSHYDIVLHVVSYYPHTCNYKYKEKIVILQSIGIIAIKSSETRSVIYTCRYSSGHF